MSRLLRIALYAVAAALYISAGWMIVDERYALALIQMFVGTLDVLLATTVLAERG